MSARDRLAATLAKACETESVGGVGLVRRHDDHPTRCLRDHDGFAAALLATDDTLAADIEDGAALRRLREALPDSDHYIAVDSPIDDMGWDVSVESIYPSHPLAHVIDPRLAAAADKAREAIEADR